jgi:transcription termination/antitermination protein NusG
MRIDGMNETERIEGAQGGRLDPSAEPDTADEPEAQREIADEDRAVVEEATVEVADPVQVLGEQIEPERTTDEPSAEMPEPVEPEPEEPQPDPEPVEPEPVEPEPVEPEPVGPEPVEPVAEVEEVDADLAADDGADAASAESSWRSRSADDPFRGDGEWYVVHTYSGYENKVKTNLESRIHTMQMEGKIFGVHIPMEDVMEIKSGKKQVVKRKQFPGYLLVRMIYDNDSWYVVRNTPGVTGFVSAGTGSKPTPLSKHEVEKILAVKKEEVRPQVRLGFEEGDVVRITSGPFADFNGTINEINPDQAKLKVLVNIFDRETPVELSFDQVSKV